MEEIRLTQYSHGAGCGCKISPAVLDTILHSGKVHKNYRKLVVGNVSRDDAAVYDLGGGKGLISTTDFFMPIVDDAEQFGMIAAANAISDVYAMGGTPLMAIAILGWPVNKIPAALAGRVLDGARKICDKVHIPVAGGHSIDSPEPIFGLAVNGIVALKHLKRNNAAKAGDLLYLTKPLGVGILTTALKKGALKSVHRGLAEKTMTEVNSIGEKMGKLPGVNAMTDVTGFGLLGHLSELCEGGRLSAKIEFKALPVLPGVADYIARKAIPGGTFRNWDSYGQKIGALTEEMRMLLCDPQTSGGLLIAVAPEAKKQAEELLKREGLGKFARPVGILCRQKKGEPLIAVG